MPDSFCLALLSCLGGCSGGGLGTIESVFVASPPRHSPPGNGETERFSSCCAQHTFVHQGTGSRGDSVLVAPRICLGAFGESGLGGWNILVFIIIQLQPPAEGDIKSGRLKSRFFGRRTCLRMTTVRHSERSEESTFQSPTISLRGGGTRSVVREAEASLTKPGVCALMKS